MEYIGVENPESVITVQPRTVRAKGPRTSQQFWLFDDVYFVTVSRSLKKASNEVCMGMNINEDFRDGETFTNFQPDFQHGYSPYWQ
jgi:hypothetical protein